MQISVNGKPVADLAQKIERRLTPKHGPDVAEGAVLSAEQSTSVVSGRLRVLYGVVCGVAGVILIFVLVGTAFSEPGDLVLIAPVYLVVVAGVAWLMRFVYRRNLAKQRGRAAAQLPRMSPIGTNIRADADGLSVGPARYPWSRLVIDAVEITDTTSNDDSVSWIERLELTGDGRRVVLDTLLIGNGGPVLAKAWRELTAKR